MDFAIPGDRCYIPFKSAGPPMRLWEDLISKVFVFLFEPAIHVSRYTLNLFPHVSPLTHTHARTRIHSHTHAHTHHTTSHKHTGTHTHTFTNKHTHRHQHTHTHTRAQTHTHAQTFAHAHTHTRTHANSHTHTQAYTHSHTHADTHTHTPTPPCIHPHTQTQTIQSSVLLLAHSPLRQRGPGTTLVCESPSPAQSHTHRPLSHPTPFPLLL